jgi:tRNA(Ile)-lysidine synthase
MDLKDRTLKTVRKYSMLNDGDNVLIGLSGGPDSVCLSVILDKLRDNFNISLYAVYINHSLRPEESKAEEAFCQELCKRWDINFYMKSVDVQQYAEEKSLGIQEAARELRYQVFDNVCDEIKADRIAVGHNADDQAETVLMRLMRGLGRSGLSGIPPMRDRIIRPLIEVGKDEIEDFLEQVRNELPLHSGRPYVIDSSNLKETYLRNWVRINLMKEIKKQNPSFVHEICRTADIFREEEEYLELIVTKTLMRMISRKSNTSIELFITPLEILEKPVLRRVLRRAIKETRGLKGIGYEHVESIISLIKTGKAGDRIILPDNIRVVREYALLKITLEIPLQIGEYALQIPGETKVREIGKLITASYVDNEGEEVENRDEAMLDADRVVSPLKIRHRAEGDYFYPLGFGKRKKLQDFFVDEKIPRDERDSVPVVLSGNDIIWVAGYRADDRFRVTDKTEKILKLIITGINKSS